MNNLKTLEEKSIYVLREAKRRFKNLAALWSTGKDSTVMLALARKAFFGQIPFPAIHIDNGIDFPETYRFREELSKEWNFKVLVAKSIIYRDKISGIDCCGANKTEALMGLMKKRGIDGLVVSIRRDEHGIRAKERYFSPRDRKFRWDYKSQPPEVWNYFSQPKEADHIRIHPILHWREIDIWNYIRQERLPIHPLYFAKDGRRYRSLGCTKCTISVPSDASSIDQIVRELGVTQISERAGRAQDKEKEYVMQRLRALGYM